jgi:hypothetical protein
MGSLSLQDAVGLRGESIFFVALTKLYGRPEPIFNPRFLGEKYPAVDYLVELIAPDAQRIAYFFVQVKTTREGYTKRDHRLKVKVSDRDVARLGALPAPAYLVGVDEVNEIAYLVSANQAHPRRLSSLSTRFPINEQTQDLLFHEVMRFWHRLDL